MYKTIAILLSLLLVFGMLSCNLDGSGIFLTISESTEIADSTLAAEPVRDILYKNDVTNIMYILHGFTVKKSLITDTDPTWVKMAFPTPVVEAVYFEGATDDDDKLYFSSIIDGIKTVYVSNINNPGIATPINNLIGIQVIDMLIDGNNVYVITYGDGEITISAINAASSDTIFSTNTFSSTRPPTAVHFVSNGTNPANKHFIFVHSDATQGYINSFLNLSDLSTATVFNVSDDAAKNSPIIGAYAYDTTIYLVTNEGILITSDVNLSSFTAVNKTDPSEFMSLVLTSAITSIPMTVVTIGTTELLLIGGLSGIYYYDIASPSSTDIPLEFTSDDAFYSSLSSTPIMDFYNVPGDFPLYTATSDKWIWQTTDEESVSTQLL